MASATSPDGAPGGAFAFGLNIAAPTLPEDVDDSGTVDRVDVALVVRHSFVSVGDEGFDSKYDVTGDGVINMVDMMRVRDAIGATLPSPSPAAAVAPAPEVVTLAVDAAVLDVDSQDDRDDETRTRERSRRRVRTGHIANHTVIDRTLRDASFEVETRHRRNALRHRSRIVRNHHRDDLPIDLGASSTINLPTRKP